MQATRRGRFAEWLHARPPLTIARAAPYVERMRLVAGLLILNLAWVRLAAAECDREQTESRLAFLHDTLTSEQQRMRIWSYTWGSIYATTALTQGALIAPSSSETRKDLAVGTGSAVFGSLSLFLLPLRVTLPIDSLRDRWAEPDRCRLLEDSERVFRVTAAAEAQATGWIGHAGNVVFNVGLSLLLGLAFGHWQSGLLSGGIGIAVGELNLLTQPARLNHALSAYDAGAFVAP